VGGGRRVVYVASGSASSCFSASELLRMAAGSRGLWGLDFVGLDFFFHFWIQEMWCLWTISCQREVDCCLCNAVVVWLGSLGGRSGMMLL
jgi:hypothetical protein